ncbi:AAA family ATPase [bacterium]|nr:MAG: AAA family ATPase [bacterium]
MYLKRLEIQGFKSFAKKTTLEFGQGITAIVGPNGSGKSNTADCLRWVLGEQSAKLMRGKKSEDVIFAGSDKKGRAGFAEVFATFDNRDHKIPLDAAEVSIGRRITRSGESEYLINGARVRLLDIVDLVLRSNIGTSRYTVIGQGTIDQMILAGPSEIKNLIDEASGVKTYYLKRERTLRRLEQTAQNLMRAEDLLKELEPRVKSLRRQAKRMEARAEIETELKTYLEEHLGTQWWALNDQIDGLNSKLQELGGQRAKVEQQMSGHLAKIEEHEKDNEQALSDYKKLQERIQIIQNEKNALLEQVSLVRGKMTSMQTGSGDTESLNIESHKITQRIKELEAQLQKAETDFVHSQNQIVAQTKLVEEISSKITYLQETLHNPAGADWVVVGKEVESFDKSFKSFQGILEQASELSPVLNAVTDLASSWDNFRKVTHDAIINPSQKLIQLQQELQELSKKKDSLQEELSKLSLAQSKSQLSREFLTSQLASLQNQKLQVDLELKKASSSSSESFATDLMEEEKKLQDKVEAKSQEQEELEKQLNEIYKAESNWKAAIAEEDKNFRRQQDELGAVRDGESKLQVEKARYETQAEAITAEIITQLGQERFTQIKQSKIASTDSSLQDKILRLKKQIESIGGVDELTIQEYHETESRFTNLEIQVNDLHKSMDDLRKVMDELDEHIKSKFNTAFHKVNDQFEQYFRILFNGGRAHLALVKSHDNDTEAEAELAKEEALEEAQEAKDAHLRPEEKIVAKYEKGSLAIAGVDIKATPPGKKLSSIQSLSGGERSLTSIALLCSLLTCFPSPFVVLDEVDAALDEANTIRFGQILGKLSDSTQFITITHNRETMAQANILYGVTMGDDGVSQLLSIKMDQATVYAK